MSSRSLTYTVTRPKVLVPGLFALGLILGKVSLFWGMGLLAFAVLQASRLLSSPGLDHLLRLREDKRKAGIGRLLFDDERTEILAIDRYAQKLDESGGDPGLGREILDRAWQLIRDQGPHDASGKLRAFRHSLPRLDGGQDGGDTELAQKLERELHILRATRKEMESCRLPEPEIIGHRSNA